MQQEKGPVSLTEVERFKQLDKANNEINLAISFDNVNAKLGNFNAQTLYRQRKKMFEKLHSFKRIRSKHEDLRKWWTYILFRLRDIHV